MTAQTSPFESIRVREIGDRPIRAAVVGLSSDGLFHVESFLMRAGFEVVAVTDSDPHRAAAVPELDDCPVRLPGELPHLTPAPDVVVLCETNQQAIDVAEEAVRDGAFLLVEPAVLRDGSMLAALEKLSKEEPNCCRAWRPNRCDDLFRPALDFIRGNRVGAVRRLSFLLYDLSERLVASRSSLADRSSPRCPFGIDEFADSVVDQLLCLLDSPVSHVSARILRSPISFGDAEETAVLDDAVRETGVSFEVRTNSGIDAHVEIDLACFAPLSTGWMIQCERGGFGQGAESRSEADGEVYHVPVTAEPVDSYAELESRLRRAPEKVAPSVLSTLPHEAAVLRLLETIRLASASDRAIDIAQ